MDSKESIPQAYVVCSLVDLYDNPIPTRFLAPIDCSKIPARARDHFCWGGGGRWDYMYFLTSPYC
jgi:hypothetical protein